MVDASQSQLHTNRSQQSAVGYGRKANKWEPGRQLVVPPKETQAKERWWHIYEQELPHLKTLSLNAHRRREELQTVALAYMLRRGLDADGSADPSLNYDEVRALAIAYFTHRDLPAPPLSERTWYFLWIIHDRDSKTKVSITYALDFVLQFADDIVGLLEGTATKLLLEPGIVVAFHTKGSSRWYEEYGPLLGQVLMLWKDIGGDVDSDQELISTTSDNHSSKRPPDSVEKPRKTHRTLARAKTSSGNSLLMVPEMEGNVLDVSREVMLHIRNIFNEVDGDFNHRLSWSSSDVQTFLRRAFRAHGEPPPYTCKSDWHSLLVAYHRNYCDRRLQADLPFESCLTRRGFAGQRSTASRLECVDFAKFALALNDVGQVSEDELHKAFSSTDKAGNGELEWHKSEVVLFARRVFGWRGLPSAGVPVEWWYLQFRDWDKGATFELGFHDAIEFLKLVLARLLVLNGADPRACSADSSALGPCAQEVDDDSLGVLYSPSKEQAPNDLFSHASTEAATFYQAKVDRFHDADPERKKAALLPGHEDAEKIRKMLRVEYGSYENAFSSLQVRPDDILTVDSFAQVAGHCGIKRHDAPQIFQCLQRGGDATTLVELLQLTPGEVRSLDMVLLDRPRRVSETFEPRNSIKAE